jgi:hypothetical protein
MKTLNPLSRNIGLAAALAFALAFVPAVRAADGSAKGGGAAQLKLLYSSKPIVTGEDAAKVKPGDTVAMACPKCKTIMVSKITQERGQRIAGKAAEHLCPGCGVKYETSGHGKAKTEKVLHTCNKCGSTDAFCCVMKKGDLPMEEKQEK